jgi:hypothetical protein
MNPKPEPNLNFKLKCDTGQNAILRWGAGRTIIKEEEASLLAGRGIIDTYYGSTKENMVKMGAVNRHKWKTPLERTLEDAAFRNRTSVGYAVTTL